MKLFELCFFFKMREAVLMEINSKSCYAVKKNSKNENIGFTVNGKLNIKGEKKQSSFRLGSLKN